MNPDLEPSAWLNAARAQSLHLAELRASRPALRVAMRPASPWFRLRPLMTAAVCAVAVLLVSGAWAWVHRDGARRPLQPSHVVTIPSVVPVATVPAATKPMAPTAPIDALVKRTRPLRVVRKIARVVEPPPPTEAPYADEPYGDVIFGKPLVKQAPLFTTEEYKSRGILVP